jgi:hypothetical protein
MSIFLLRPVPRRSTGHHFIRIGKSVIAKFAARTNWITSGCAATNWP